jgi:hypothetical protein
MPSLIRATRGRADDLGHYGFRQAVGGDELGPLAVQRLSWRNRWSVKGPELVGESGEAVIPPVFLRGAGGHQFG